MRLAQWRYLLGLHGFQVYPLFKRNATSLGEPGPLVTGDKTSIT